MLKATPALPEHYATNLAYIASNDMDDEINVDDEEEGDFDFKH